MAILARFRDGGRDWHGVRVRQADWAVSYGTAIYRDCRLLLCVNESQRSWQ